MTSKKEFESKWGEHIKSLYGLGWNLSVEDSKKLNRQIKSLLKVAKKASENKYKNDCIHCGSQLELSDYGTMVCTRCEEPQYLMA